MKDNIMKYHNIKFELPSCTGKIIKSGIYAMSVNFSPLLRLTFFLDQGIVITHTGKYNNNKMKQVYTSTLNFCIKFCFCIVEKPCYWHCKK